MSRMIEKPWGHEEIWAETNNYVGKVIVINSGHRLSRQYHNLKEETFRVLEGTLQLEIGGNNDPVIVIHTLLVDEVFHCPPKTVHRMCNYSDSPVKVLEVSTNHLDDVVRLEDDYNR